MKKFFLFGLLSLTLLSCDRQDKPNHSSQAAKEYDNTETNIRDRGLTTKTPLDQSENEVDRSITQKIRQALMSDDSLSVNAKNIKIITNNSVVTLRGPVASFSEREAIIKKVQAVSGIVKIDNQLDVTRSN